MIGFVGLAAPAFARWTGARTFARQLTRAPVIGALLLLAVDRGAAFLAAGVEFPTGVATALLGAPLLLVLMPTMRRTPPAATAQMIGADTPTNAWIAVLVVLFPAALSLALFCGPTITGWRWLSPAEFGPLAELRGPRVAVAAASGVLLAAAGSILQRVTGNPVASPEALGVSAGSTLGILIVLAVNAELDRATMTAAALAGAMIALAAAAFAAGKRLAVDRLLLAGFSLAALASACASLALSVGDPRTQWILTWLSGSTYRATSGDALLLISVAGIALASAPALSRWLTALPLGAPFASSIGLNTTHANATLLAFAATCTAVATLSIGPLSFIGLIAPHIARYVGFRGAVPQLVAAAAIGSTLLIVADWLGRSLIYPWQIPAGTITALLGGANLIVVLKRAP